MKIITRKEARAFGLKRYFTGKPCKRGHVCERHVSDGNCASCRSIGRLRWDKENPAKRKMTFARNRKNNPDRVNAWKQANPDRVKDSRRRTREKDLARKRARRAAMTEKDREKERAASALYRAENLTKRRESARRYQRKAYYEGPINPTGELAWLRKNAAQLRALKRALRNPADASVLLKEASILGLNLPS